MNVRNSATVAYVANQGYLFEHSSYGPSAQVTLELDLDTPNSFYKRVTVDTQESGRPNYYAVVGAWFAAVPYWAGPVVNAVLTTASPSRIQGKMFLFHDTRPKQLDAYGGLIRTYEITNDGRLEYPGDHITVSTSAVGVNNLTWRFSYRVWG